MEENKTKVSVIIPVYNEELYIKRCLDSVVNQTLQEIEIIVVDDGSADNTPEICDDYAERYKNKLFVIHKQNEGQALARNVGINSSRGEFIGFVDGDDWVELDMFYKMYAKAVSSGAEIIICDVKKIFVEEKRESVEVSMPKDSDSINIGDYIRTGLNPAYAWNKIYRRKIWEHYRFRKMVYEDLDVILVIESFCSRIAYVQEALINYYKRPNSTTTSYNNIRLLDIMEAYRNASFESNSKYKCETTFCVAKRILINMSTRGLIVYKAEFIELINELEMFFINNRYIINDEKTRIIYDYLSYKTIPKRIFISNFNHDEIRNDYWDMYTRGMEFIELNEINCDITDAPASIKWAYINKNYRIVGDYFKIKSIFERDGIAADINVLPQKPLGELRAEEMFFLSYDDLNTNPPVFGGQKGRKIFAEILSIYESWSGDEDKFNSLISDFLQLNYKEAVKSFNCFFSMLKSTTPP